MAGSKSKLDKMSMPSKKKPLDDVTIMELEMEPSDEGAESDADMDLENEMAGEADAELNSEAEPSALAVVSDEDLLAEMRKRGLSAAAEKAAGDEPMSDSEY